jgi:lipid II:glycine glycyltransferase (peptidoglycan interpeptide bridge formation enzyme)
MLHHPTGVNMLSRYTLRAVSSDQREQWDAFVSGQPTGHLLQSWGWGELKASAGWHPLRMALWDTEQQRMVAAAQVLRRTAAHLPLWSGHLAYIPRGPVCDWSCSTYQIMLSELNRYVKQQGALALQMEPVLEVGEHKSAGIAKFLDASGFHGVRAIQPARTIVLDITPDEESLLAHMKEKWRYNVRLAGRKGVQVRAAQTVEDVRNWYRLLQTTGDRDDFGIHTLEYYLQVWRIFVPRKQARLFLAEYDGQLLGGIFVGLMAKQAIYLYGASSNEQRNLMPNYLLQWEAIRWAKSEGATSYDFWGIPETDDEDEAMAGVYRFKSGWGGRVVRLVGNYEYVYRPLVMQVARKFLS